MSEPTNEELVAYLRQIVQSGKFPLPTGDVMDLCDRLEATEAELAALKAGAEMLRRALETRTLTEAPQVQGSIADAIEALREAVGYAWDGFDDPGASLDREPEPKGVEAWAIVGPEGKIKNGTHHMIPGAAWRLAGCQTNADKARMIEEGYIAARVLITRIG